MVVRRRTGRFFFVQKARISTGQLTVYQTLLAAAGVVVVVVAMTKVTMVA